MKVSRAAARNWSRIRNRLNAGDCRDCGKPRGKTGTKQHCRLCADAHNRYQARRYRRAFHPDKKSA